MRRAELLELITNGENSGVEFKRDSIAPEKLAREVVALANFRGGRILLGVADDGVIHGISRPNLAEWIADTVIGHYVHPQILPYYEEVALDEKKVAILTIGEGIAKPYVVRAKELETAYIRVGPVTRAATREQLLTLGAAGGMVHAENMPVQRTGLGTLDRARLQNYLQDILKDPDIPASDHEWTERLLGLGFLTEGAVGRPVCTVAGLVLFGINPRAALKQAGVRLMFFDSADKTYRALTDKQVDGPLVGRFAVSKHGKTLIDAGLIEKTLELMEPFVTEEADAIDENFRREKSWRYPFDAMRELMVNALAHRDWTKFNDVEICGYSDRLEIISPGSLPDSMTVDKMLAGQRRARNPAIVEVLRDYGYVDARGMGLRVKVVPALEARGLNWTVNATEDYLEIKIIKPGKTGVLSYVRESAISVGSPEVAPREVASFGVYPMVDTADVSAVSRTKVATSPSVAISEVATRGEYASEVATLLATLRPRMPTRALREVILGLCALGPLSGQELATLVRRDYDYLRNKHLTPMIRSGQLRFKHAENPNHPQQSYVAG